jgi:glycosyltransferase involved in cell wall biosynthesis
MNWPKITVVTPSYNQMHFLGATLESVRRQAYPNLEHILIDGGSKDGSLEIVKQYKEHLSYWVSESDAGQTEALIKGFARATGEIFCWLNSDDLFLPNTLRDVAEHFAMHPYDLFIYGNAQCINRDGIHLFDKKEIPFNWFIWLYNYNYIPQPSCFWKSTLYNDVGGLNPAFDLAMDADLWARFAEVTKPIHVKRTWSQIRLYPEQKNQRLRQQSNQEDMRIRSRYIRQENAVTFLIKKYLAKFLRTLWRTMEN